MTPALLNLWFVPRISMKPISKQAKYLKLWAIEIKCESESCISMNFLLIFCFTLSYLLRFAFATFSFFRKGLKESLTVSLGSKQAETFTDNRFTKINMTERSRRKMTNLIVWKFLRSSAADVCRIIGLTSISIMSVCVNDRVFSSFSFLPAKCKEWSS